MTLTKWVNLKSCSLNSIDFADKCRQKLSDTGVLLLPQFLLPEALNQIIKEAQARTHLAYFTKKTHNVYLSFNKETYFSAISTLLVSYKS